MSTPTLALDAETSLDALSAVRGALEFFTSTLAGQAPADPGAARSAAERLHRAAEAMTALADQAEALPDNVIDFAAAFRARRERIRSGGTP